MIKLSPSQLSTASAIGSCLNSRGSFCVVSSQPGFGLTTCLVSVRARLRKPVITIADHPGLAGLDLIGQLYDHLKIDAEFQTKKGLPSFAVEIISLRGISTIFIDDIDLFLCGESATSRTLQQLQWILTALPSVNIVISGIFAEMPGMHELVEASPHSKQAFCLAGFQSFNEYMLFFESILAENSQVALEKLSLEALYLSTKGNLSDTLNQLFHPARIYQGLMQ